MRKIREILRLKFEDGESNRQIAAAISVSRSTFQECLRRERVLDVGRVGVRCRNIGSRISCVISSRVGGTTAK